MIALKELVLKGVKTENTVTLRIKDNLKDSLALINLAFREELNFAILLTLGKINIKSCIIV
jgi:hypothetical protein